ncbi:bifunctional phosphopantothenoylcysteine decarboxylase/phosphopantothenate--cysteine ligase CoaBC [Calditerricola satsumensis]|uniref:bifunctional phosphopantothenoylcysteine decarboxylase/phosphopantothenate--cysteine ligase CoaBC n=1 Tax=Calditerricola satsumensis TaxID=373054 RepID=UPI001662AA68|nr:bifunctional phosphopantothenoylcysteine decarboxylase/phosphopantothenate--cysteine ligase CoaBC [Calditerricola satsumensis]
MKGKTILLGVTGGIAAYKAAALTSRLVQQGADVHVILTEAAARFVTPLTFQALSRNAVHTDVLEEKDPRVIAHIDLADRADLVIVAPATANFLAKAACGLADDMLSAVLLATRAPVLLAPAMNVNMYRHPAVQANLARLRAWGWHVVEPGEGYLACGWTGKGRMAEPEAIAAAAEALLAGQRDLAGLRILVTAGATQEALDPVRYLTNRSSGKMGYAIAEEAARRGAEVILVTGPTALEPPADVRVVRVTTAQEMYEAVLDAYPRVDVVIKAAAVADYRPKTVHAQKMKKGAETLVLELERTPDILQTLGERKAHQFLVGFAAETERVADYAQEKLKRKNLDLVVANDVTQEGAGFGADTNIVAVYDRDGLVAEWPKLPKREVAARLLSLIAQRVRRVS